MKQIKNIIVTLMVAGCCTACSDILDKGPLDAYSEKEIWNSPEMTQAFNYTTLFNATGKLIMKDQWTDNTTIQEDGGSSNVNKEQIDRYYDAGWDVYSDIRRCNMVIARMAENTSFSVGDKEYFVSQAKMMRAMIYYTRARFFGKLMLVDRLVDVEEDMRFPRTATIKDTYDFIIKDLQEAAPGLPVSLISQQGMLTRGAAYALLAEVALHGAAYIESGQAEYYTIAQQASESLFELNAYELDTDYKNLFNNFNYAMNSKEIILAQWRHEDNTTFQDTWMQELAPNTNNDKNMVESFPKLVDDFAGWPLSFPSVDLVNTYQVVDGDGVAKEWNETSYYRQFKENGGYVSDAIYKNRDKRFYATVVYDSTQYVKSLITTREKGNLHWNSNIYGDWGMTKTGYLYRKGVYEEEPVLNSKPTYYHFVLLRLGRSYLNYAEVMLRQQNSSVAIEYINKTRTVHGGLPALSTSLSLEEAWREYKRERRLELAMEGDRYWSLLRWGKAEGKEVVDELTITHQAISISADGKAFEFITLPYKVSDNIRMFTKKRYLMPVPQSQREQNTNLDQNEGW